MTTIFNKKHIYLFDSMKERLKTTPVGRKSKHISHCTLTKEMNDKEILECGVEPVTLRDISMLIDAQKNGEKGTLLTNGYTNILYVRRNSGSVFAAGVSWDDSRREWGVDAIPLGGGPWDAGRRVLSATETLNLETALGTSDTLEHALKVVKDAGYKVYKEV